MRRILAVVLLVFVVAPACGETYRIVVIPDTQFASEKWPHLLTDMTKWIVENKDSQNIKCVLHVGDMVQNGANETEWQQFDKGISALDGKVPYVLAVGNHDFDKIKGNRSAVKFNEHFPVSRFKKMPGFGGSFPEGTNDSSYHTFHAGKTDWLVVSLKFNPSDEELAWADRLVAKHPDHRVIILTHSYLTHGGRDTTGKNIWKKLVARHGNISLVACGHLSTVHFQSDGEKGNQVYEMLFDWQNNKAPDNNSYFAILELNEDKGTISVRTYSPTLDKYKTDRRSEFKYENVDFLLPENKALK